MKKHLIIWFLISSFLLGSCSIDWKDEKDKKIDDLEKQVQELKKENENDIFKKKQECEKYKDQIEIKENELNNNLKELFYSNKYSSCLYSVQSKNQMIMRVKDFLSWKEIQSRLIIKPMDVVEFNDSLNNLK